MKTTNVHINYVEFKAKDLTEIKSFYQKCFKWEFEDFGLNYTAFSNSGIEGGFEKTNEEIVNGALVILYHNNLEELIEIIVKAKGVISTETFSFPGGRRFHFIDPSGNELAVWSDT